MSMEKHGAAVAEALARHRAGLMSRRQVVRLLGTLGVGLTAAGAVGLGRGRSIGAASNGHRRHQMYGLRQDGTPEAMATPTLGPQADGTTVWRVVAGDMAVMAEGIELTAFFPAQITVNAGDSIYFDRQGFHNVHFYPNNDGPTPEIIPDPAATPTAGPPRLILNPEVAFPYGGTTFDGTAPVNSGLPLAGPEPFTVTLTAPGTYEYWCDLHGALNMMGTVVVQEAGAAYPMDQAGVDEQAAAEQAALLEQARALIAEQEAMAGTPMAGMATPMAGMEMASPTAGGAHQVAVGQSAEKIELNIFFPRNLTIAAGETVRWVYTSDDPPVPHTVTFLSGGEALPFVLPEGGAAGPPTLVLNPQLLLPAGGPTYSGQGLVNSGLMITGGGPTEFALTFDTPGTYDYYCAIHGEMMSGTVTVQ